jgi:integrase
MASRFTDKQVKSLLKDAKPGRYAAGGGLYFRISEEGTGFWVVRYTIHGKRREITLGRYPEISLADANLEVARIKGDISKSIDPLAERNRADQNSYKTVDDLAEDWLKDCEKRLKHPKIPRRVYEKDLAPTLGRLGITQVTPRDIRATIGRIAQSDRPTIANDALMYCKQLFRHGIKLDLLTTNPAEVFRFSDAGGVEESRSRALSLEEVTAAFKCFRENGQQFTRENYLACALLVSLGVRKGELVAAKWEEFDMDAALWHIPKERSKTGMSISVPLPDMTMEWLKELRIRAYNSDYVFPNRRASKRHGHISPDTINSAIMKLFKQNKMQIEHFTIHDLRRTCRSLLSALGVPGHVAERCLNHKLKGVEGIYDRYDYLDDRRAALNKLSIQLQPIHDGQ